MAHRLYIIRAIADVTVLCQVVNESTIPGARLNK